MFARSGTCGVSPNVAFRRAISLLFLSMTCSSESLASHGRVGGGDTVVDRTSVSERIQMAFSETFRHPAAARGNTSLGNIIPAYLSAYEVQNYNQKEHKEQLWPLDSRDYVGFPVAAAALFLAAGAGVGGGLLLIPIYLLIFGFTTIHAVGLSNVTIVGGAFANFAINVTRRNSHRPGPLIDWDIILMMEPATVLGAIVGGYMNKSFPPWITTVLLALLLMYLSFKTLTKGLKGWAQESLQLKYKEEATEPLLAKAGTGENGVHANGNIGNGHQDPEEEVEVVVGDMLETQDAPIVLEPAPLSAAEAVTRSDPPQLPLAKFGVCLLLIAGVSASNLAKQLPAVPCGSWVYWVAVMSLFPAIALLMHFCRLFLVHEYHLKVAAGSEWYDGEVKWSERNTVLYPSISSFAGIIAGLFGLGGGVVKGPLMLEMGVAPDVAAATSSTMILFTSISAAIVFVAFGAIPLDYGLTMVVVGFVFTYAGQISVYKILKILKRRSFIVFLISFFMGISSCVVGLLAAINTIHAFKHHTQWEVRQICSEVG